MRPIYVSFFAWFTCSLPACGESNTPHDASTVSSGTPNPSTALATTTPSDAAASSGGATTSQPATSALSAGTSAHSATTHVTSDPGSTSPLDPSSTPSVTTPSSSTADTTYSDAIETSGTFDVDTTTAMASTATQTATSMGDESTSCVVDHGDQVPSLHEYFSEYFAIGAAIDTTYNNYAALLTKHFNSVTAEDQMKFDALQPSEGNFTYGTADQMVNFATSNGMQVRGHALDWHLQTPAWVFNGSRDQVLARMKTHITNVMQHFKGKVQVWDVVNEAIMDDGTYRTNDEEDGQQSGWYGALGETYIAEAFKAARAADPDARLFYNDYYNYHPVRRQAIFDMLKGLLDADVPVDGVGLQAHLNLRPGTDANEQSFHQTVANLETAIEMYASLGLDVQITEMDLSLYLRGVTYTPEMFYTDDTVTEAILKEQADR